MSDLKPLLGMTLAQLQEVAAECGLPRFAAGQMARWLYVKRVTAIESMTDISTAGRERLAQGYTIGREAPLTETLSSDGTRKLLYRGAPGRDIEAVLIPDDDRLTICVSSQAGCKMGCRFCATGAGGFQGQLSTAQIINQILSAPGSEQITNIVFMGMGEPTDNLDNVLPAIEVLTAKWGLAMSPRRITVSTVGAKAHTLQQLLDQTDVHIALSLHHPNAAARAQIMPVEKALPLTDVLNTFRDYDWRHQRRLSMEYIMWRDINSDIRSARALSRLLRGLDCRVNLIRYHVWNDSDLRPADRKTMEDFRDCLNAQGITATIRASRGEDIKAACGQLAGSNRPTDL